MTPAKNISVEEQIRKRTILSFTVFFLFIAAAVFAWIWIRKQPQQQGTSQPLRTVLYMNENFFGRFFSSSHYAKTYPVSAAAKKVRVNGNAGLSGNVDTANYRLQLVKSTGDTLLITMDQIRALPKTEIVFDFKCIEGWSQVTYWGGVKFSDFVKAFGLDAEAQYKYAGLVTPDKGYYVGIDMPSILHPQTLLCYEMNGAPLPLNQGYPLRLIIPVKYGVKHLKRIGTIFFSNEKPNDYWYERGYDYYTGL